MQALRTLAVPARLKGRFSLWAREAQITCRERRSILYGPQTLETETDENGHYSFHEVAPGDYALEGRLPPNLEAIQQITITSGTVTKVNLELRPGPSPRR